jgi:hypothetical protein
LPATLAAFDAFGAGALVCLNRVDREREVTESTQDRALATAFEVFFHQLFGGLFFFPADGRAAVDALLALEGADVSFVVVFVDDAVQHHPANARNRAHRTIDLVRLDFGEVDHHPTPQTLHFLIERALYACRLQRGVWIDDRVFVLTLETLDLGHVLLTPTAKAALLL